MGVQLQLILITCIVNLICTLSVKPNYQMVDQSRNLFNSVGKNHLEKKDDYVEILKEEEAEERRAFAEMEAELQFTQFKNALRRKHFNDPMNAKVNIAKKREANENTPSSGNKCTSARVQEFIHDVPLLERLFLEHHPDTDNIVWEGMANLTVETLKEVCDQLLPLVTTQADKANNSHYTYEPPENDEDILYERTVKYGLLPLSTAPEEVAHVPVVKCFYKEKKFYLTHADDGRAFELHCEDEDQDIYTLKSGMYPCQLPLP